MEKNYVVNHSHSLTYSHTQSHNYQTYLMPRELKLLLRKSEMTGSQSSNPSTASLTR